MKESNNNKEETTIENNYQVSLHISLKIASKIILACSLSNNKEWSGRIFYKVTEVSDDLKKIALVAEDILILDVYSSGYTEYDFDARTTDYMMENPELMGCKTGHLHSHHNMAVFFSGEDMQELNNNYQNHDFYVSVIVNNKFHITGKAVFHTKKRIYSNKTTIESLGKTIELDAIDVEEVISIPKIVDINITYSDFQPELIRTQIEAARSFRKEIEVRNPKSRFKESKSVSTERRKQRNIFEQDVADVETVDLQEKEAVQNQFLLERMCVALVFGQYDIPNHVDTLSQACFIMKDNYDPEYSAENCFSILFDFIESNPQLEAVEMSVILAVCKEFMDSNIPNQYSLMREQFSEQLKLQIEHLEEEELAEAIEEEEQANTIFNFTGK